VSAVKVSVVIPLYNARDVIAETIKSVLAQTWTDYEIIVVDDGSQDGSGELVQAFGDRVRYIRQQNTGVAGARNRGIEESHGEYIALLDHDDLWHPTKLAKQVDCLEKRKDVGMVITDVIHIDQTGKQVGKAGSAYNPHDRFYKLFVKGYIPTPSSAMIRRSIFDQVGRFEEAFHSAGLDDHELWPRIAQVCEITNIPEPLTCHRLRTIKPPEIALVHRQLLVSKLLEQFGHERPKRRYMQQEQARYFCDVGKHLLKTGHRGEARSQLLQGLRLSLSEGRDMKTACRCVSRLVRSYFFSL
jgi:glycosyltransferase involved in cell wall biosynthesis